MFQATAKADIIKHIIDATSTLVDEAKIQISKDGLSLRAVDPAHVAMVDISIGAKAFESFRQIDSRLSRSVLDLGGERFIRQERWDRGFAGGFGDGCLRYLRIEPVDSGLLDIQPVR